MKLSDEIAFDRALKVIKVMFSNARPQFPFLGFRWFEAHSPSVRLMQGKGRLGVVRQLDMQAPKVMERKEGERKG
jgi:hypothetical protein